METIIETVTSNNLYMIIAGVIILFLVYAIFKKLLKLVIVTFIILACYIGYIYHTGNEVTLSKEIIEEKAEDIKGKIEAHAFNLIQRVK